MLSVKLMSLVGLMLEQEGRRGELEEFIVLWSFCSCGHYLFHLGGTGTHFHLDCNRTNVLDNTNSIGHLS